MLKKLKQSKKAILSTYKFMTSSHNYLEGLEDVMGHKERQEL